MAFGRSSKKAEENAANRAANSGPLLLPWLDLRQPGIRHFQLLPFVNEKGDLVDENGRKSKRGETEGDVPYCEIWYPVNLGGQSKKLPIMLDFDRPYDNPIWEKIKADNEGVEFKDIKDKPQLKFALNVYEITPVIKLEDGTVVYRNENREFVRDGKRVEGDIRPANRIMVLVGSTGKKGGDHLAGKLERVQGTVDDDTTLEPLLLHEFRLKLIISQRQTKDGTRRTMDFQPDVKEILSREILTLPRYNLEEWARPWSTDMLERLLDGEDYNELIKEYKILRFPRKFGDPDPYAEKETAKKDEEGLFNE